MVTIIAKGKKYGFDITITVTGVSGNYTVEIEPKNLEEPMKELLDEQLDESYQVVPLFYPDKDSLIKVEYVLSHKFFDYEPNMMVVGEIEKPPYIKGVIY